MSAGSVRPVFAFQTIEKLAAENGLIDAIVQLMVPVEPAAGMPVQVIPAGGVNDAKVALFGVGSVRTTLVCVLTAALLTV